MVIHVILFIFLEIESPYNLWNIIIIFLYFFFYIIFNALNHVN